MYNNNVTLSCHVCLGCNTLLSSPGTYVGIYMLNTSKFYIGERSIDPS